MTVPELVKAYGLQSHPEGGYFKESYRSKGTISAESLPKDFQGTRSYSTAIYFLLPQGSKPRLHRIKSDEVWHFYQGGPLTLIQLFPSGRIKTVMMGPDFKAGQKLQHVVPAGCWFGAYPGAGSAYSFVGCTVAPGFDFADFELGDRQELLGQFPQAKDVIERLTASR
ncbi:MAG: cupin domain-containing protein [Elusimicrobia bacterium]|nr:cupin domain-containing protein [Elusimicrobiota bacterium]